MRTRRRRRWLLLAVPGALVLAVALGWGGYAAVTWLAFGRARASGAADPLLERHMPRFDIVEVHRTRVRAPASATYAAARTVDLHHSPVVHMVFRGRELLLGADAPPRPETLPLVTELRSLGWGVLEEVPRRQLVLGAVTQPWKAEVVFRALPPDAFARFDSAGWVKIVVTLAADSLGPGESEFRTETRALATDPASRARFRRYWSVFSPGIRLIRSQTLSLVRREAERRPE